MPNDTVSIRKRVGFSAIPNAAMSDRRLSIDARGLLALLLTMKEGWKFRPSHLMQECNVGRDRFYRMLAELRAFGYVEIDQEKNEHGHFLPAEWQVFASPCPENPDTGEPESGKPDHIRITTDKDIKDKTPIPPEGDDLFSANEEQESQEPTSDGIDKGFEQFWTEWPKHKRKIGKADCAKVYRQACEGKHPKSDRVAPGDLNRAARAYVASVKDREYLKGPLPWLRQPGWESFLDADDARPAEYSEDALSTYQKSMLQDGVCPPSMLDNGQPTAEARYWLRAYGYGEAAE